MALTLKMLSMAAVAALVLTVVLATSGVAGANDKPDPPTNLALTNEVGGLKLTWTAPSDTAGIRGYRVLRRSYADGETKVTRYVGNTGSTATVYLDTDVTEGNKYRYRVRTLTDKTSAKSRQATITYQKPISVPQAPTGLTATADDDGIDLSWTAPASGDAPTGYRIMRKDGDGSWAQQVADTETTDTEWSDSGLTDGTTYTYKVMGLNSAGEGAESGTASAIYDIVSVPQAPTGLTATADDDGIDLSWTAPASGDAPTGYRIMRHEGDGSWAQQVADTGTTATEWSDSGLTDGTTYTYKVMGLNSAGQGAESGTASAIYDIVSVPQAPTGLTVEQVDYEMELSWTAPASGDAPTGYRIMRRTGTDGSWDEQKDDTGTTDTEWSDSGLTDGTTYTYKVMGLNSAGEGAESGTASAIYDIVSVPQAPTGLTATADDDGIDLSWTAPASGDAPTGYRIMRHEGDGSWAQQVADTGTTATEWSDSGLTDGTTYTYKVMGLNSAGQGAESGTASAIYDIVSVPQAPTGLTVEQVDYEMELSWTAPASGDAPTGYRIMRKVNCNGYWGEMEVDTGKTATEWSDSSLTNGITYYYKVKGVNSAGGGAESNTAGATYSTSSDGGEAADDCGSEFDQVLETGDYVQPLNESSPLDHPFIWPIGTNDSSGVGADPDNVRWSVTIGPLHVDSDTETKDYIFNFIMVDEEGARLTDCEGEGLGISVHLFNVLKSAGGDTGYFNHFFSITNCSGVDKKFRMEVMDGAGHFIARKHPFD